MKLLLKTLKTNFNEFSSYLKVGLDQDLVISTIENVQLRNKPIHCYTTISKSLIEQLKSLELPDKTKITIEKINDTEYFILLHMPSNLTIQDLQNIRLYLRSKESFSYLRFVLKSLTFELYFVESNISPEDEYENDDEWIECS